MKGWAITIFSALLALFASSSAQNIVYLFSSAIPAILFWYLDACYLQRERKYRRLYNDVAGLTDEPNRKAIKAYDMSVNCYRNSECTFFSCLWSVTLFPLYLFMLVGAVVLGVILQVIRCT